MNNFRKQKHSSKPVISTKFPLGFFQTTKNPDIRSPRDSDSKDTKKLTKVLQRLDKMPDQSTEKLFQPYFEVSRTFSHFPIMPIHIEELITLSQIKKSEFYTTKKVIHSQTLNLFSIHQVLISSKEAKDSLKSEIEVWQSLKCHNFIQIFKCFWNIPEGHLTIVSQFLSGCSLKDLYESIGSLPESLLHNLSINLLKTVQWVEENVKKFKNFDSSRLICTKFGEIKLIPSFSSLNTDDSLLMSLGKLLIKSVYSENFELVQKKCCFFHSLPENPMFLRLSSTFKHFLCKLTRFSGAFIDEVLREPWLSKTEFTGALVSIEELVRIVNLPERIGLEKLCDALKLVLSGKNFTRPNSAAVEDLAAELGVTKNELEYKLESVYNDLI